MMYPKPKREKKTQYQKLIDRALGKKEKYRAEKVRVAGIRYDSKLEERVHQVLLWREKAGELEVLQLQAEVRLTDAEVIYKPDFKCRDLKTGEVFFVEAKGFEKPEWRIKRRLWAYYGPGKLEVWKASPGSDFDVRMHEVITPKKRKGEV